MASLTRPIEMAYLWPAGEGDSGHWGTDYVSIPIDTPTDKIAAFAEAAAWKVLEGDTDGCVAVLVYNIPPLEDVEDDGNVFAFLRDRCAQERLIEAARTMLGTLLTEALQAEQKRCSPREAVAKAIEQELSTFGNDWTDVDGERKAELIGVLIICREVTLWLEDAGEAGDTMQEIVKGILAPLHTNLDALGG